MQQSMNAYEKHEAPQDRVSKSDEPMTRKEELGRQNTSEQILDSGGINGSL
jgi:hypothetical protein